MFKWKNLKDYVGRFVEIYATTASTAAVMVEKGQIVNIVSGFGENAVFIELDNGTLINSRYIVKIVAK